MSAAERWIEDMDDLRHAVGMVSNARPSKWGYRNYYNASLDHAGMLRMEALGFVTRGRSAGESVNFYVTEAGCKAIGLPAAATRRALG